MRIFILFFVLLCIVPISASTPALAQYDVQYFTVSSGGDDQADGSVYCYTTVGQPIIDISSDVSNRAELGFLHVLEALYGGPITAVMFSAVGADLSDDGVMLQWEIVEADGLEGFNVYRSQEKGTDCVRLNDSLLPPGQNSFTDPRAKPGGTYWYAVGAVDRDGESISLAVKVEVPIKETALFQNFPNPFNPATTIVFYLPVVEHVNITIYDISGKKVRQLVNKTLTYGTHRMEWNGRNDQNKLVGSGIYFYKLTAGKKTLTKKMVLLR